MHHGNARTSYLDQDFLQSGDYAQIKQTAQVLDGLMGPDGLRQARRTETSGQRLQTGARLVAAGGQKRHGHRSATKAWAK